MNALNANKSLTFKWFIFYYMKVYLNNLFLNVKKKKEKKKPSGYGDAHL
jgi:surface polysaccharide O-acyltransferase-like enzyme